MTTEIVATAAPTPWAALDVKECRILGVLVEKAKTTPEAYPLSLNALVTGGNQKSNRDPVMQLTDEEVEETLTLLQKAGLVTRITGGRVDRWRHNLYEVWSVDKVELAVLAELLLRGAQTEGELRGRASRMEPLDDLDKLRQVLHHLKERGLVVYLGPEGRRGTTVTHGFHAAGELESLRGRAGQALATEEAPGRYTPREAAAPAPDRLTALEAELAQTRAEVAALQEQVSHLANILSQIAQPPSGTPPPSE